MDSLEELRSHSLLTVRFDNDAEVGITRYHLLETVRQYAHLLLPDEERADAESRHRCFFLSLAQNASASDQGKLSDSTPTALLAHFEHEQANFLAALMSCEQERNADLGLLVRLVVAVRWIWDLLGYRTELRYWLNRTVTRIGLELSVLSTDDLPNVDLSLYAEVLRWLASTLHDGSEADRDRARTLYTRSESLFHQSDEISKAAQTRNYLGSMEIQSGRYRAAYACLSENIARLPEVEGDAVATDVRHYLGVVFMDWGEYLKADTLFTAAERLRSFDHQKSLAVNRGFLALYRGDLDRAEILFNEALAMRRRWGFRSGAAFCLTSLGNVADLRGDNPTALRLHEEALLLTDENETPGARASVLGNRGIGHLRHENYPAADADFDHALRLYRATGEVKGVVQMIEHQADLLCLAQKKYADAVALWAEASLMRAALGTPLPLIERPWREQRYAEAITGLGIETFDRLWFDAIFGQAPAISRQKFS